MFAVSWVLKMYILTYLTTFRKSAGREDCGINKAIVIMVINAQGQHRLDLSFRSQVHIGHLILNV